MNLSLGISLGRQRRGAQASVAVDTAPSVSGTYEVGETLTRTIGSYSGTGTVTVSNGRWIRDGVDISPAQTGATYTLVAADDGAVVQWAEDATDDNETRTFRSAGEAVTYPAPVATGSIGDQDLTYTASETTIVADVTSLFGGADLSYSVAGYGWVRLDGSALKIDPATLTSTATVTLTASNSGGTASISFDLIVEALAFTAATFTGSGKIGGVHTAAATVSRSGASLSYDFERDGVSIGAADQATYTPVAADDLTSLSVVISATVDGVTIQTEPAPIAITYPAPVAAGGLSDQSYSTGSGDQTVDASTDFTGGGIVYSVTGMGATINPSTGVVTIPTDSDASGTITVTGTNSGGADSSAFSVTIAISESWSITGGVGDFTVASIPQINMPDFAGGVGEFTTSET